MKDWNEADRRLVDWLKDRTDVELQRLLDAPDDGLTNQTWTAGPQCKCLGSWALGWEYRSRETLVGHENPVACEATDVLDGYGLTPRTARDDGTIFRHIKAFVAAELLTRRVDRKALPSPREAAHA